MTEPWLDETELNRREKIKHRLKWWLAKNAGVSFIKFIVWTAKARRKLEKVRQKCRTILN